MRSRGYSMTTLLIVILAAGLVVGHLAHRFL
jgi:hypothetical protein